MNFWAMTIRPQPIQTAGLRGQEVDEELPFSMFCSRSIQSSIIWVTVLFNLRVDIQTLNFEF